MAAAPADNSSATERARASFHHGVQLYSEGSFEAALAEFRKAYQISPNYRLLYNIAQAYFDLHDYVSSFKSLRQYVQEGGNELSAARRNDVNELNQKLEERIAFLDIGCNVDGADIRVDDMSVGVSPLTSMVPVNAGPRRISAVKPGYTVAARMVTVVGREKVKVPIDVAANLQAQGADGMPLAGSIQRDSQKTPMRIGLTTSAVVAGGCAIATGVFGILALQAKGDFDHELGKIFNSKDNVDSARTRMKNYAYLTDAFGAATLVSGGVALYFLLTETGSKKTPSHRTSVALTPTVGGMLLHGQW
jgi:tetratricopeptide (TPR) repeat protein